MRFVSRTVLLPLAFVILLLPWSAGARRASLAGAITQVGLTSGTTSGGNQGRWRLLDWYAYPADGFRFFPADSGPLAGWTLPEFDDSAWDDYTRVVWDHWWNEGFAQPSLTELGPRATIGREGFVNRATYLYRRYFDLPAAPPGYELRTLELQAWSDNNAVFYINGQLVFVSGFPSAVSMPLTPRQLGLRTLRNVLAIQVSNDDQGYNPIGVQFRLVLNYDPSLALCITGVSPASPQIEGTPVAVIARAEDGRGVYRVEFLMNSATDGSTDGSWWTLAEVAGEGHTICDARATIDWNRAPAGFPRMGTHRIVVNSYFSEGQLSARWQDDPCRQRLFTWMASATPTATPTASAIPSPTVTVLPSATLSATPPTPTPTETLSPYPTPTPSPSATPGRTATDTPLPTSTPTATMTGLPTATATCTLTPTPLPRLEVSVRDWHDPLIASWRQRYTIVVANVGPVPAHQVTLVDMLPARTWALLDQSSAGATLDSQGRVVWEIGTMPPGATQTYYLEIGTSLALTHCSYVTNRVEVWSAGLLVEEAQSHTLIMRAGQPDCGAVILP